MLYLFLLNTYFFILYLPYIKTIEEKDMTFLANINN